MNALYPLRFAPIYQYRLWGGRRLSSLLSAPLPGDGPIGEAWLLSDREDHPSRVSEGALQGQTLAEILAHSQEQLMGKLAGRFPRFPLLLKFLDTHDTLSVQVHPSDLQPKYIPAGESGKTEAWVVLETSPGSRIYAGLQPGATAGDLRDALADKTMVDRLPSFSPNPGDAILLPAGTVHSLGGLVVFEVQQNSDVTFRLYDWDHIDPKTGEPRPLQVDQALACIDYAQGIVKPAVPVIEETAPVRRERLLSCEQFQVWRQSGALPFLVGANGIPRIVVCIAGEGQLEHGVNVYALRKGDTILLPAALGECICRPYGSIAVLEIALPEGNQ